MAISLASKQFVPFEELVMSLIVSQDALIKLLIEKGIFTQEEFLGTVREVNHERKTKSG
jgi:hypothetical protein